MEWLYQLEIYQIIFTLAGGGLLVTAVIPGLIRWKFKLDPSESFGKGADDAFKLIIWKFAQDAVGICCFERINNHEVAQTFK